MVEPEITSLTINGLGGRVVPNRFFRCRDGAGALAVLFPGLRYTCDMPLLYYPTRLLLQRGADVLQLHTDYTSSKFQDLTRLEQAAIIGDDALTAVKVGLAERQYKILVLMGKSIGTLALAQLVASGLNLEPAVIWLTPLLHQPLLVNAALQARGAALFICGTGDSTYHAAALAQICQQTAAQALLLENANHSLETPGDVAHSLQMMQQILQAEMAFLDKVLG